MAAKCRNKQNARIFTGVFYYYKGLKKLYSLFNAASA